MPSDIGSTGTAKSESVSVERTNYGTRNPMKFSNGDECLDDLVAKNGGHFCLSNTDLLMEVVQDPTWT
jgi:hypothetical protein